MRVIRGGQPGEHGEPEDGWQTAPQLVDTVLVTIMACKFTGTMLESQDACAARLERRHPDVDCRALYINVQDMISRPANERRATWGTGK